MFNLYFRIYCIFKLNKLLYILINFISYFNIKKTFVAQDNSTKVLGSLEIF